eukprot:538549_1
MSLKLNWHVGAATQLMVTIFVVGLLFGNIDRIHDIFLANRFIYSDPNSNYDIIIVGGGAAGIIQIHFLTKYQPDLNILLIEKQPRIGGRTITSKITHYKDGNMLSTAIMEGGALRTAYNHLLWKILFYLDLCDDIIPFQSPIDPVDDYRRYRYDREDVDWNKIYHLSETDTKYIYNQPNIFNQTYYKILKENNNGRQPRTEFEWNQFFSTWTIDGVPVYKYSIRSYLRIQANASIEFDQYFTDSSNWWHKQGNLAGYLWFYYGWNQYQNITRINQSYVDLGIVTFKNGYMSMIQQLYNRMDENIKQNKVLLNTELIGIDYSSVNGYKYSVFMKNKTRDFTVYAKNIILSIPPMNLRRLLPFIAPLRGHTMYDSKLNMILDTIEPRNMYRINLIFDSTFWLNESVWKLTQSQSNLEMNEFLIESMWTNHTLTTFSVYPKSSERSGFWNELQILGKPFPIDKNLKISNLNALIVASDVVVLEVRKQLEQLIGNNKSIPLPLAAFVYPFGVNESYLDGLNNYKYNVQNIKNISNQIQKPNQNENIFIAVSDFDQNLITSQYAAFGEGLKNMQDNFNLTNPFENARQCPP